MKIVFTYGGTNPYNSKASSMIEVKQAESKAALFTVIYGAQVRDCLTYAQASKELGECIFHHLACESILNNEGK
jgi:hypothetical protein